MTGATTLLAAALLLGADAPPEAPPPVPLVAAVASLAGTETPLRRDGESLVDPAATFRVVAGASLADARLALYDAQQALVEAEEHAEIGSAVSRYTLAPARPLRPGSRYLLRLEGAAGRRIRELGERTFLPLSFAIATTGDPPAEAPPRKKAKRRRKG